MTMQPIFEKQTQFLQCWSPNLAS